MPIIDSTSFYGKPNETYKLDDYTRLKVLGEVMREYVPGVLARRRNDGFHFMVIVAHGVRFSFAWSVKKPSGNTSGGLFLNF